MASVRRPPANGTYVKTEGAGGFWGEYASPTLSSVWGRLEKFHQDRQGVDSDELDELAERMVTRGGENTASRVITVADPILLPWTAYEPGDIVNLNLTPNDVKRDLRVASIVIAKGTHDAVPRYDVHFGSPVYSNDVALAQIQGSSALAQGVRTLLREFRKPTPTVTLDGRPEPPIPATGGGSAPTLVIAASNSADSTKLRADYICSGVDDNLMVTTALMRMVAGGGGRLLFTEGDFYFSDTVTVLSGNPYNPSYRFEGMGMESTRINMTAGANTYMFTFQAAFAGTVEISNLELDGAKASQTSGTWAGIYLPPNGGGTMIVDHCLINNMRGYGIFSDRAGWNLTISDSHITDNTVDGLLLSVEGRFVVSNNHIATNGGHGVSANGGHVTLTGNWIYANTLDGYSAGGVFQGAGVKVVIAGNQIFSNRTGILLDGGNMVITGNHISSNTVHGIDAGSIVSRPITISGNVFYLNTQRGVYLHGAGGGTCSGNTVIDNGQYGIYIVGTYWNVVGNRVADNGKTTNNTYDGIALLSGATNCAVLTNIIRQDSASNRQRYGVNVQAGAVFCKVAGNDFGDPATYGTAAFADAGTSTQKRWADDGFYGDNWAVLGEPGVPDEVVGGPDDVTAPDVPTGFAALPGDTEIFLDWADNEELDLASYKIYRATSALGTYTLLMTVVDLSEHVDTGLVNGTPLWYKISAVDESGNESALSTAVSTTPAVPPAATPPPVPSGLTAVAGDGHVDLAWTPVFASDFSHYNVYQATATGGPYTLYGTRTVPNAVVGGLTNTTPYFFVVTSEDITADESADSNEATATPTAVSPPGGLPAIDITFDSGNLYTTAKVNAEAAGTVFLFTITGGTGGGPRYESATIPTKAGNEYVFDQGAILDGNGSTVLAFARGVNDVKIYDCEFTAYQGQNASGTNNTKGAAAIRLDDGWELIRPNGHHNKYSAVSFDGNDAHVLDGRLSYNGEFGFKGGGGPSQSFTGCWIDGTEVDHNGGAQGLDLQGDQGGCKVVHSIGFQFLNVNAHDNYGSGGAASIGTQGGNGLWADINNIGTVYDGCTLTNNRGAGIFHEVSLSFEIKNCTFTNNGRDYAAANPGSLWPVSSQIQISNSGGTLGWIHDNTIVVNGTVSGLGFHGITVFNSQHFQWTHGVISNGCLGTRNLLIENNSITMSGAFWKSAIAITGSLPTSRSGDQFCGQVEITAAGSNNRIRTNTESLTGGAFLSTPYIRSGTRVSAGAWAGFGYS